MWEFIKRRHHKHMISKCASLEEAWILVNDEITFLSAQEAKTSGVVAEHYAERKSIWMVLWNELYIAYGKDFAESKESV